jgi:hypothetical protein
LASNVTVIEYKSVDEIKMVLTFTEQRIRDLETEIVVETTIVFGDEDSFKMFNIIMMGLLLKIIRSSLQINPLAEQSSASVKKQQLYDHEHTSTSPQDLMKIVMADIEDAYNSGCYQELFDRAMCLYCRNTIGDGSKPHQDDLISSSGSLQGRKALDRRCKKKRRM